MTLAELFEKQKVLNNELKSIGLYMAIHLALFDCWEGNEQDGVSLIDCTLDDFKDAIKEHYISHPEYVARLIDLLDTTNEDFCATYMAGHYRIGSVPFQFMKEDVNGKVNISVSIRSKT